ILEYCNPGPQQTHHHCYHVALLYRLTLTSIEQEKELEMTPALETEAPVASTSSKPPREVSKDRPKGPQKKQRGPNNHQSKGKGKANWHRHYPKG
ncbi:hypothetical protein O181_115070, partial [Austropuccinia psidii MF-1]|nr:hypothetical protein [Austropuccinia psidii MF-1]